MIISIAISTKLVGILAIRYLVELLRFEGGADSEMDMKRARGRRDATAIGKFRRQIHQAKTRDSGIVALALRHPGT
jgi:hypothetical protein